jgi:hypothetical protein
MYSEGIDIMGLYLKHGSSSHMVYSRDLLVGDYVDIPTGNYVISLGNNFRRTLPSTETFFKDVKIWKEIRTLQEIEQFKFSQIGSPYPSGLLSYMKFVSGTPIYIDQISGYEIVNYDTERLNSRDLPDGVVAPSDLSF